MPCLYPTFFNLSQDGPLATINGSVAFVRLNSSGTI